MTTTLDKLIALAIEEDIGSGDITTKAIVPGDLTGAGGIYAKQDLIVAGIKAAEKVFKRVDLSLKWEPFSEDGDHLEESALIARISGPVSSMLSAERIALNFLQHLSGIATFTRIFVEELRHTKTKILDTRKTRPGFRELEKEAVRLGDGENHRMGLYDRYLIKDNHIEAAGSIAEAVKRVRRNRKQGLLIEVETRDLTQAEEAVSENVDIIMLDNFTPSMVEKAVMIIRGRAKVEVSGNINLNNIKNYAKSGVDFISIGAITHSAPAADISMLIR